MQARHGAHFSWWVVDIFFGKPRCSWVTIGRRAIRLLASAMLPAADIMFSTWKEWPPSLTQAPSLYSRYGKMPAAFGKVIRTSACTTWRSINSIVAWYLARMWRSCIPRFKVRMQQAWGWLRPTSYATDPQAHINYLYVLHRDSGCRAAATSVPVPSGVPHAQEEKECAPACRPSSCRLRKSL